MDWIVTDGACLGGARGDVALCDGRIAEAPGTNARRFDAGGLIVAPGLCDVHGDGFERNLSPRPGVLFDVETALLATDRELVAHGITTAFLAMTIGWEPGLRSIEMARTVVDAIDRLRPRLSCDIRLQLRWETFALDAVDQVEAWLAQRPRPVLAFNDHLTGLMRSSGDRLERKLPEFALRAGVDVDAYRGLIRTAAERADEVPGAIERLARAASAAGVACFAHDEADGEARRANRAIGIGVSEFPLSAEAAAEAVGAGEQTVLGAPNVVRGGSHIGCLDAGTAIRERLCTVLASDYFYPALLQSVCRLEGDGVLPVDRAWPLISVNAAHAAGLTDRGTLRPGQRGDIVVLSRSDAGMSVEAVFSAGRPVLVRDPSRVH